MALRHRSAGRFRADAPGAAAGSLHELARRPGTGNDPFARTVERRRWFRERGANVVWFVLRWRFFTCVFAQLV